MKILCVSLSALMLCSCLQNDPPELGETPSPPPAQITDERALKPDKIKDSEPKGKQSSMDEKESSENIKAIGIASKDSLPGQNENKKPLPKLQKPSLVVKKKARLLEVFDNGKFIRTYKIALGFAPDGDKAVEGVGKTPEGEFYVFTKNEQSRFYLSLGLSYPNAEAARRGLKEKLISREEHDAILKAIAEKRMPPQKTALGGEIYIHGGGRASDWTWGCVALPDEEIKVLFEAIPIGTVVVIQP